MSPPRIDELKWQRFIGSGGFADVHLYKQARPRRSVAVKVLKGLDPLVRDQFIAEADAMVALEDHPNITPVYFTGVSDDGRHYLVMPYYPQENFADRARRGPLPVGVALKVGIQVAGAIDAAHRGGILHRDVKPANILVDKHDAPRLSDFGIAGRVGIAATGDVSMSVPWAPPEVLAGQASSYASDIYSLGATVWHLLAGRSPFEAPGGDNSQDALVRRIQDPATRPRGLGRSDVPVELEQVLLRAMSRDPALRPRTGRDFALALQSVEYRGGLPTTTITMATGQRPPQPLYPTFGPAGSPPPEPPEDKDKTVLKLDESAAEPEAEVAAETSFAPKRPDFAEPPGHSETRFRPQANTSEPQPGQAHHLGTEEAGFRPPRSASAPQSGMGGFAQPAAGPAPRAGSGAAGVASPVSGSVSQPGAGSRPSVGGPEPHSGPAGFAPPAAGQVLDPGLGEAAAASTAGGSRPGVGSRPPEGGQGPHSGLAGFATPAAGQAPLPGSGAARALAGGQVSQPGPAAGETSFRPRTPTPPTGPVPQAAEETSFRARPAAAESRFRPPPGTPTYSVPPQQPAQPRPATALPEPRPQPPDVEQPVKAKPKAAILLGAAATVVAVVTGVLLLSGGGEGSSPPPTTPTRNQQNDDLPPGKPTIVAARVDPATVRFTWTYSAQFASDTFAWRTTDQRSGTAENPMLDLPSPVGAPVCVQIKVVRADGSNAATDWSPQSCVR